MNIEQQKLLQQLAQMGDVVLINEGNRIHLGDNGAIPLETQADAILYFLQRLDIKMLNMILEDDRTYQDFEKPLFIKKLNYALEEFIENGNTYLNRYEGFCYSKLCDFKCKGYSFIGNNSGHYFDLIIDIKNGVVHDIYECFDFKIESENLNRSNRVYINNVPF